LEPLEGGFESFASFRLILMLSCKIPDNEYSDCQLKKIEHVAQEKIPLQISKDWQHYSLERHLLIFILPNFCPRASIVYFSIARCPDNMREEWRGHLFIDDLS
jgi:hypothetical protein